MQEDLCRPASRQLESHRHSVSLRRREPKILSTNFQLCPGCPLTKKNDKLDRI